MQDKIESIVAVLDIAKAACTNIHFYRDGNKIVVQTDIGEIKLDVGHGFFQVFNLQEDCLAYGTFNPSHFSFNSDYLVMHQLPFVAVPLI